MPCLRLNGRLRSGYDQRTLRTPPPRADLWIQAASVGEAYLAWEVLKRLAPQTPTTVLLTTNTSQGFDILNKIAKEDLGASLRVVTAYCPFDQPSLMARALAAVGPKAVVLLESELWPGLLAAGRQQDVKLLVINGRMTQRSLERYLRWPTLWRDLRPTAILAMSQADSGRFAALFGSDIVSTMTNIKFDRIQPPAPEHSAAGNPLVQIIAAGTRFIVLGSVRQEEEAEVALLLDQLAGATPPLLIGLFPRHMHRLGHWQKVLTKSGLAWRLRSHCTNPVPAGTILLWDTMGELQWAYELARAAFVGGSLAPVGGQNFLEPISCGIKPVIGPHWTNFAWIGREIFEQGLVHEARDWQEVARTLTAQADAIPDRCPVQEALAAFVARRQGGSSLASEKIKEMLGPPAA
jgi:3-deoxy-D-manno-octulosonic-acid transferase